MGKRKLTLLLLFLSQTSCLASGFWIHHQFAAASISQNAHQQGWAELDSMSQGLILTLKSINPAEPGNDQVINPLALQAIERHSSNHPEYASDQIFFVDTNWKILAPQENAEDLSALVWNPLKTSASFSRPQTPGTTETPMRGFLNTANGRRLAMAYPLKNLQGYLVAARSPDSLNIRISEVSSFLVQSNLIAFVWAAIILSFATYLIVTKLFDWFLTKHNESETESMRHAEVVSRTRDAVIFGLAKLTESRDPETGGHLERIALYSSKLSQALRRHPKFRHVITSEFVRLIEISSSLHDIGKVGIEDTILLKPGPLTSEERKKMQEHAVIGGKCIQDIEQRLGSSNFLQMARQIAYAHHEKWDGTGYPHGLSGEEIPLAARVVALVDVYEALSSKRVYKDAMPHDECVAYLKKEAGKHFDPNMIETFLEIESQFRYISSQFADSTSPEPDVEDPLIRQAFVEDMDEPVLVGAEQEN